MACLMKRVPKNVCGEKGERIQSLTNMADTDTGIFAVTDTLAVTTYEQKPCPSVESHTYIIE